MGYIITVKIVVAKPAKVIVAEQQVELFFK
jgi:hypothetical protein